MDNELMKSLLKKALGFTAEEIVEEYAGDDAGGELLKRKVTKKPIPPDVSALKTYLELVKGGDEFRKMSDEELSREKERLIKSLSKTGQGVERNLKNKKADAKMLPKE